MKRLLVVLAFALAAALPAPDTAQAAPVTYTIDRNHSDVGFLIRHFVARVRGHFTDFSGTIVKDDENLAGASVVFQIQAGSIDTNNEKRDADLRSDNFFDVAKFPTISFASNRIEKAGAASYKVTGNLTMHGVTQQVTLPVEFAGEVPDGRGTVKAGFSTTVTINRKEFGITWNRILDSGSAMLGDDVEVQIEIEATRK